MVQTTVPSYYQYWGKARKNDDNSHDFHLLPYHCLDVAAVGYTFLTSNAHMKNRLSHILSCKPEQTIQFIAFFLAIHDLGKFSESFQNRIPDIWKQLGGTDNRKSSVNLRHDSLGYLLWDGGVWQDSISHEFLEIMGGEDADIWQYLVSPCARAVFGHHGRPPDTIAIHNADKVALYTDADARAAGLFAQECLKFFLKDGRNFQTPDLAALEKELPRLSWLLSGLAVISDWIGSDSSHFLFQKEVMELDYYWNHIALPSARSGLSHSGIGDFPVSQDTGILALFPWLLREKTLDNPNPVSPSPLQEFVSSCNLGPGPHLFIIEESTGGGKTEAAVTLAHRMMAEGAGEGMYIALPTMATANAMYERMKECYLRLYQEGSRPSLILSHGSRHLSSSFRETIGPAVSGDYEEYGAGEEDVRAVCADWLSDHRKASLLASIGVGTIDQALVGILPASHQSLRILGLIRNILVVDEVHAYDPYMNRLLQSLLSFQAALGGSAILLSATLPRKQRESYLLSFAEGAGFKRPEISQESYPLVTHLSPAGPSEEKTSARTGSARQVSLEFFESEEAVITKIRDVISAGGCACWIRNTVADALSAYEKFSQMYSEDQVFLFHARFAMGDRIEIENRVMHLFGKESDKTERAGRLLIATQVVEQSLDIDFDYLVSDLAPIDLIIQRAGRLHRHKREGRGSPILGIFAPPMSNNPDDSWYSAVFKSGSFVYPKHGQLWLTLKVLKEHGVIRTPDDARTLIEYVYGKDSEKMVPEGLKKRDDREEQEQRKVEGTAMMNTLNLKRGYSSDGERWDDDERVKTRYGEPSVILRLGLINESGNKIIPLCTGDRGVWELSSVSVRRSLIPTVCSYPDGGDEMVQAAKKELPDKGKWSSLIPLKRKPDGEYYSLLFGSKQETIEIRYSRISGLSIMKMK